MYIIDATKPHFRNVVKVSFLIALSARVKSATPITRERATKRQKANPSLYKPCDLNTIRARFSGLNKATTKGKDRQAEPMRRSVTILVIVFLDPFFCFDLAMVLIIPQYNTSDA